MNHLIHLCIISLCPEQWRVEHHWSGFKVPSLTAKTRNTIEYVVW